MTTALNVMFCEEMVAPFQGTLSPSAAKPALVMDAWKGTDLPLNIMRPERASYEDLCRAHIQSYVDGILDCSIQNGFGTKSPELAASLPWTSGALLSAARYAISSRQNVCAPVSGFHHAGPGNPQGFCTFNGLMVAALALLASGEAKKVFILDCDQHYGNGTDEIINYLGIPSSSVQHFTAGDDYYRPDQIGEFWGRVGREFHMAADADVVLYQAGADPHINDPYGGWMTTDQLRRRDRLVFQLGKMYGIPIAWDFAGGYQRDASGGIPEVIKIHTNTARECLE